MCHGLPVSRLPAGPMQGRIPSGYIEIRPIEEPDLGAAMVLLTRAFAGTPDSPAYTSVM